MTEMQRQNTSIRSTFQTFLCMNSNSKSAHLSFCYATSVHCVMEHAFMSPASVRESHVGLCLTEPVFTHGQLYIALSRVMDGANLRMIVPDTEDARKEGKIKNIVYTEVFN